MTSNRMELKIDEVYSHCHRSPSTAPAAAGTNSLRVLVCKAKGAGAGASKMQSGGLSDATNLSLTRVTRDPSCGFAVSATTPKGSIQAVACTTVVGYDLGGVRPDLHQTSEVNAD